MAGMSMSGMTGSDFLADHTFWRGLRVCVTGGAGFLGQSLCPMIQKAGAADVFVPRRKNFDLTKVEDVRRMYDLCSPDVVIHLAAEVGGIGANRAQPGRFFFANMAMGLHLIEEARRRDISKFVQVGTVCAYPKYGAVPFKEDSIWEGFPEETNAPYGIAKKSLMVMLQAYRTQYGFNGVYVLPANLYGPGDNFDLETSHVIPAMIRKFQEAVECEAQSVTCWGTGRASREFLYVDDAARGIIRAAERLNDGWPVNLGTGVESSILHLAELVRDVTGFEGEIVWDNSQPDGQPRRGLDVGRARAMLGWSAEVELREGLQRTAAWYRSECKSAGGNSKISGTGRSRKSQPA
jgi:GDP-L-fucose synthase